MSDYFDKMPMPVLELRGVSRANRPLYYVVGKEGEEDRTASDVEVKLWLALHPRAGLRRESAE